MKVKELEKSYQHLEKELQEFYRDLRFKKKEVKENNHYTILDLSKLWKNQVRKPFEQTATRKPDLVQAHKLAIAIIKELKGLR